MAVGTINRRRVSSPKGEEGKGVRGQAKMNSKSFCAKVLTAILVICSSRQALPGSGPGLAGQASCREREKDAKTITTTAEDNSNNNNNRSSSSKDNDRRRFQLNLFALR